MLQMRFQHTSQLCVAHDEQQTPSVWFLLEVHPGVSLDIENYCTLRLFFDLPTLAGLNRRNLPEAGIRLLFQI